MLTVADDVAFDFLVHLKCYVLANPSTVDSHVSLAELTWSSL